MSILISPSNNTGWGLGTRRLFGGARVRSSEHPVAVRSHFRANWGSRKGYVRRGRARGRRAPMDAATAAQVEATIDHVARHGPPAARAVIVAARRNARYGLRQRRRLTPAGLAVMAALRARRARRRRR